MGFSITRFKYRHIDKNGRISIGLRLRFDGKSIEFPLRNLERQPYKISFEEYNNPSTTTDFLINHWKEIYAKAFHNLEERVRDTSTLNRSDIINEVNSIESTNYKKRIESAIGFEITIENEEEVHRLASESFPEDEVIDQDEYDFAYGYFQNQLNKKKAKEDFSNRNKKGKSIERSLAEYNHNGHNRTSIILSIGELHLLKKVNGVYQFPSLYRGILKDLYAYQFDLGATDNVDSLSKDYFVQFLVYLLHNGVITTAVNATPYELHLGLKDDFFKTAERRIIKKETFKDKVKALNKTIMKLRTIIEFEYFESLDYRDYLHPAVIDRLGSKKDEGLNSVELETLLGYETDNQDRRLSLDIFLIMVFAGGLRGYNPDQIYFNKHNDSIISYQGKKQIETENPILEYIRPIIERHQWKPPNKPSSLNVSKHLREIATELDLTRGIKYMNTSVGRDMEDKAFYFEPLNENLNLKFARKTLPDFLRDNNFSREEIASFTGHVDPSTLKHYISDFDLNEKRKMIESKIMNRQA